jgi:hypothetical protein
VKTIAANGQTFKLGRNRPKTRVRLHMRDYLRLKDLPPAPATADYALAASAVLGQMFENDQYGCCVIAGGYHFTGVETSNAGDAFIASNDQVLGDYAAACGFDPKNPQATDNGCDEQTVFNYWGTTGFADGTKLAGSVAIDGTNQTEVMQSIFLFENCFFGIELPDDWVNSMPSASGFVWDVAGDPNPANGHAFLGVGYTAQGVIISTWGMLGLITWAAIAKYATQPAGGQLYALLTPDQISKAQLTAPNGLAWSDLQADFAAIGGAQPAPAPAPDPTPTPTTGPTLAEAQQATAAALQQLWSGS